MGRSTLSKLIPDVCAVLWDKLASTYMKMPATAEEWLSIAASFNSKWQFPNCLGAIDGKHIVMKSPNNSGSMYFNYKGTFSIVLLALVDADLQFIMIDIGSYGRNSDGGIFANSNFGQALAQGNLPLPEDTVLPDAQHLGELPYVFIGDEAFPLQKHLMRPYPGRGSGEEQQIFNYRLSRARRCVESAFGLLAARWRIFHTKIGVKPDVTKEIVKATVVLHNFLQRHTTAAQTANILQGYDEQGNQGIQRLQGIGQRVRPNAVEIRNKFKEYVSQIYTLPWQERRVHRGYFGD